VSIRPATLILAVSVAVAPVGGRAARKDVRGPAQQVAVDDILAAWLRGDTGILASSFTGSRDLQNKLRLTDPRELERWLGAFDAGKAALLLALADTASRVAPQDIALIVRIGRRYVASAPPGAGARDEFVRLWHRVAIGLLEGYGDAARIEEHLIDGGARTRGERQMPVDPRLTLALAIAQERRCWEIRPSLDQPSQRIDALSKAAGARVGDDLDAPRKAERKTQVAAHRACLQEAVARFTAAASAEGAAAEARVRGAWILFQAGRLDDALNWLQQARPGQDPELAYWRDLFRGRVLDGLNRYAEAAEAYRTALSRYPVAQSATIGYALDLFRTGRAEEADDVAHRLRASAGAAADPWAAYINADRRFVPGGLEQLRLMVSR
jgi:tetratricopeptide (TPR) repeat protein